jgi:hypothetical protein
MSDGNVGGKVLNDLQKDFKVVGKTRIHGWYAWAIVGIVAGMLIAMVYVANRSGQFSSSNAQIEPFGEMILPGQNEPLGTIDPRVANIELTPLGQKIMQARAEGELRDVIVEGGAFARTNEGDDLINFDSRDVYSAQDPIMLSQLNTKLQLFMSGNGPFRVTLSPTESYFLNGLATTFVPPGFNTYQVSNEIAADATTGTAENKKCECSADVTILFVCKDSNGHLWMPTGVTYSEGKVDYYDSKQVQDSADAKTQGTMNATENAQNNGKNPDGTPKTSKTTQLCPADDKAPKCSAQPCIDKANENALANAQKVCDKTSVASQQPKAGALTAEAVNTKVNSQTAQCNSGPLPTIAQ